MTVYSPSMVYTDPKWLGAVLAKYSRDNSIVDVFSVETESAVGVGDNYGSVIIRATLKVLLGSGKVTTRRVVLKKAYDDLPDDVVSEMLTAFLHEGLIYNGILSKYSELLSEFKAPYGTIWPECFFSSHDIIVLEDLKESGFTLGTRRTGLDLDHARLVFTNLARFHSLSIVAMKRNEIFPKRLPPFMLLETSIGKKIFKTSLTALADVIRDCWSEEWSNIETKIRDMSKNVARTLTTLYCQQHKLSVVNHGDCWVNNMMFRYNSQGCPEELKFVDFQDSHYNSYGWDLTYFLHTSIHPKLIPHNTDSFVQIYCQEFADNLVRLGHDERLAPTVDDVKEELIRLRPFAVAVSCSLLPLTANPGDVKLSLEELINDTSKMRLLFEDKNFDSTVREMFANFIHLGIL